MTKTLNTICGALCAMALFAIMALTFFDVGGRKLLSHSIPGSLELTELLMVIVIFAGLPLVSLRGEHVVFDSLDSYLPRGFKRLQQAAVNFICAVALLALAWLMFDTGSQFAQNGETTAQLKIAKAPFIYAMAVACFLTAAVHAWLVFQPFDESAKSEVGA